MRMLLFLLCFFPATLFAQCEGVAVRRVKSTVAFEKRMPALFPKVANAGINLLEKKKAVAAPVTLAYNGNVYSLLFAVKGRSLPYEAKGAYAVLANGELLRYPDAESYPMTVGGKILYFAGVPLSRDDLQKILTHTITDVQVAAFECSLAPWFAERLKTYFNCLVKAN